MAEGCKRFFFYLVSVSLLSISISFFQSKTWRAPVELWAEARKVPHFSEWLRNWQRKVLFSSSTSSSFLHQLFFRQSRKEKLQKKAALSRKEIVRCFRAMEIIGSGDCGAGTRRYVGAFLLWSVGLRFWLSFWLLKVIALRHPATFTASCLWFPITLQQATGEEAFLLRGDVLLGGRF